MSLILDGASQFIWVEFNHFPVWLRAEGRGVKMRNGTGPKYRAYPGGPALMVYYHYPELWCQTRPQTGDKLAENVCEERSERPSWLPWDCSPQWLRCSLGLCRMSHSYCRAVRSHQSLARGLHGYGTNNFWSSINYWSSAKTAEVIYCLKKEKVAGGAEATEMLQRRNSLRKPNKNGENGEAVLVLG